jgi:hypothetical protein
MIVMVHSKGSSGDAVYELPEPVIDVVGAALDVVVVAESAGIEVEVSCSATADDVVEVTAGGVVSVGRSVASSRGGRDVVAWVSLGDESVEPQDCKVSSDISVMVRRPAHCLAISSAYLLHRAI